MASLLRRVRSRLYIASRRNALHQLDGQYRSRARGRGMDFDDLREYIPGDDVRDIDWNATARSASTLIRRYRAERKQQVTFVANGGRSMSALTRAGESKRELAVDCIGMMASLSTKHGDDVGLLLGDETGTRRVAPGNTDAHLERILQLVNAAISRTGPRSDMAAVLDFALRSLRRRGILVCVSDEAAFTEPLEQTLTALSQRHEVIWLSLGDTELQRAPERRRSYELDSRQLLPTFLTASRSAQRAASGVREAERDTRAAALDRLGISHATIHAGEEILPALVAMFAKRGYSRG